MRHSLSSLAFLLLLSCWLSASRVSAGPRPAGGAPAFEAVLISKDDLKCGDEAALVTDPAAVAALVSAVRGNQVGVHACAYHWNIAFITSDGTVTHAGHNVECERYVRHDRAVHRLLDGWFDRAERGLEQFLVDVTIDASLTVAQASEALAAEGRVVSASGESSRLPSVTLRGTASSEIPADRKQWDAASDANERAATKLVESAVAAVLRAKPGARAGVPGPRSSSFGGGRIEDDVECRIELPFGTDPASLPPLPPGISVAETDVPRTVVVQLVTPARLDEAGRAALRERHPFLLEVTRHDEGCAPAR